MSEYTYVSNYMLNLRRHAVEKYIKLFEIELKSAKNLSDIENLYAEYCTKACNNFERECDEYKKGASTLKSAIKKYKPIHLQKIQEEFGEFKAVMKKSLNI